MARSQIGWREGGAVWRRSAARLYLEALREGNRHPFVARLDDKRGPPTGSPAGDPPGVSPEEVVHDLSVDHACRLCRRLFPSAVS